MTMLERAEAAERAMSEELDRTVVKSVIYTSGERDPRVPITRPDNGKRVMMGPDPRLPKMPDKPTLFDFFKYRFGPANHLMQSARLAMKNGVNEPRQSPPPSEATHADHHVSSELERDRGRKLETDAPVVNLRRYAHCVLCPP